MEENIWYYEVYGLKIISEIKIEEFLQAKPFSSAEEVINISFGKVNEKIKKSIIEGNKIFVSKDEIYFHIDNIATYLIKGGNSVLVDAKENYNSEILKIYIMGSVLGFILLQREMIAIHGSTIDINNKGLIITGQAGAGKSSLATALTQRGYKFISDDVASLKIKDAVYVYCGFPYHKISDDMMENLGFKKSNCSSFTINNKTKYLVEDKDNFKNEAIKLKVIIEVKPGEVKEVIIEEKTGAEKLEKLLNNIYRIEYLNLIGGLSRNLMRETLLVTNKIKYFVLTRPKEVNTLIKQINLVEQVISEIK